MIQKEILELIKYALHTGLIQPADTVYTINKLLELFEVNEMDEGALSADFAAVSEGGEQKLEEVLDFEIDHLSYEKVCEHFEGDMDHIFDTLFEA